MEHRHQENWRRRPGLVLVLPVALGTSCRGSGGTLTIDLYKRDVVADDGSVLSAFDLHLRGHSPDETPAAWMFYLIGSEPVSVMQSTEQFADLVARGFCVVLLQPRGVKGDGTVDLSVFRQYETRQRRAADQVTVMDAYLARRRRIGPRAFASLAIRRGVRYSSMSGCRRKKGS